MVFVVGEKLLRETSKPNLYSYKDQLLEGDYESIVLGNSHALRGIIAENLSCNTINLSNVSQTLDIDLIWLNEALKQNQLKVVIINFSIPSLTGKLSESVENWRLKNYNLYTRFQLSLKPKYNFEILNGILKDNILKLIDHSNYTDIEEVDYLAKGSYPLNLNISNFEEHAIEAAARHTVTKKHISNNVSVLKQIIDLSIRHNAKVLIVTPPAHLTYRTKIPVNIKSDFFDIKSNIQKNYNNIYWLDFFEIDMFKDYHFKDSDHLNLTGAQLFTDKIDLFLKSLNLCSNL